MAVFRKRPAGDWRHMAVMENMLMGRTASQVGKPPDRNPGIMSPARHHPVLAMPRLSTNIDPWTHNSERYPLFITRVVRNLFYDMTDMMFSPKLLASTPTS
jgi:hypothetical protein